MRDRPYPPMPYWEHSGHGHPALWLIAAVLLAMLVTALVALVLRWRSDRHAAALGPTAATGATGADALSIVRMRYARGEIDREHFLQTTADLEGKPRSPAAEPPPDAPTQT
jgi:uncharacterized membrane protein